MADKIEVVKFGRKEDVISLFCDGYTPRDIYEKHKLMSKKTTYKYYGIYRRMKEQLRDEVYINKMVKILYQVVLK